MAWAPSTRSSRWVAKTVEELTRTFVFLHKPIWNARDLEKNGWAAVEPRGPEAQRLLRPRPPLSGVPSQWHRVLPACDHGRRQPTGTDYGEFDHVAWITMKKDKPLIANVMLDGILPSDLRTPESEEKGVVVKKVPDASGRGPAPSRRQAAGRRDGHLPPQRDEAL